MAIYNSKNAIIYDPNTDIGEFIFPDYQTQINFPKYEEIKKEKKESKNFSQLEIKLE